MKEDNVLLIVAILAVVVAFVSVGLTYSSLSFFTGRATEDATVNVTVTSSADINFTTENINFGAGTVDAGKEYAIVASNNTVTDGGWTPIDQGLVVENIGNVNVTFNVTFGKTAAEFIGGTDPVYQFMVSENEEGSCIVTGGFELDTFTATSTSPIDVCNPFPKTDTSDELRFDIYLKIPSDSLTGALGDVVTLTYEEAS